MWQRIMQRYKVKLNLKSFHGDRDFEFLGTWIGFAGMQWIRRNFLRSRGQSNSNTSAALHVMKTLIVKKYLAVLEFMLVFFFLQICLAIVAIAGIKAAVSMIQLSGG